jgi:quercetin dioxygenase-like cupin family protein
MSIHRKQDLVSEKSTNGMIVTSLSGPEMGDKMITVKEILLDPGSEIPVHLHPDTEETHFLIEGELTSILGDNEFTMKSRDCMMAPTGMPHGMKNNSDKVARLLVMFPKINPERESVENHKTTPGIPNKYVSIREDMDPYEFAPGIMRYDMVGDFTGAKSSYFCELNFNPGASAPNHYHPHHEESMYCLEGKLNAVYNEENNIELYAGDMFTAEVKARHGCNNPFDGKGTLLAIHCVLNPPPRVEVD